MSFPMGRGHCRSRRIWNKSKKWHQKWCSIWKFWIRDALIGKWWIGMGCCSVHVPKIDHTPKWVVFDGLGDYWIENCGFLCHSESERIEFFELRDIIMVYDGEVFWSTFGHMIKFWDSHQLLFASGKVAARLLSGFWSKEHCWVWKNDSLCSGHGGKMCTRYHAFLQHPNISWDSSCKFCGGKKLNALFEDGIYKQTNSIAIVSIDLV